MIVELEPIKILFVRSTNGPIGANEAFNKLESKLPTLKKRKFYGIFFGNPEEYWACVAQTATDDPEQMGLETGTIPGGKYAQKAVVNWHDHIALLEKTFKQLAEQYTFDSSRPSIEYYRSITEVVLRLPIKEA